MGGDHFPHDYICPITQEIMRDPVIAGDGHSYERKAIKKWFKMSLVSPKTGAVLSHPGVTRNYTLRAAILTYINTQLKDDKPSDEARIDIDGTEIVERGTGINTADADADANHDETCIVVEIEKSDDGNSGLGSESEFDADNDNL